MTVKYSVRVSDDLAAKLEHIRDEEIENALVQKLESLAERDEEIQRQQDELHERMGIDTDDGNTEELSEEEMKRELQRFIRGKRDTDPRLEN
mgnify:CR=1 FL=1